VQDDNWDDLRFVLEVAEAGSVSAAARRLGVNASTVVRRIGAAETRFGTRFFERTAAGYAVPPDSLAVIATLREAREAIDGVTRRLDAGRGGARRWLRVTSTDTFCLTVLPGIVAGLARAGQERRIELLVSNTHLDFARLHADVAVRPALRLPDDMSGEVVAELNFGAFEGPDGATGWVGLSGPLAATVVGRWIAEHVDEADITARADSFPAVADLVAAGAGRGLMPRILAEGRSALSPADVGLPPLSIPVWVACHADMADAPRLRRLRADLGDALSAMVDRL